MSVTGGGEKKHRRLGTMSAFEYCKTSRCHHPMRAAVAETGERGDGACAALAEAREGGSGLCGRYGERCADVRVIVEEAFTESMADLVASTFCMKRHE